jgi:hypothetical protein
MSPWIPALINFILPLLFIASIGFLIYAIILFLIGVRKSSRPLRIKSLKITILPILYIVGTLSTFAILDSRYNTKMLPELTGTYLYYTSNDSSYMKVALRSDNTFVFENPHQTINGRWTIETNTYLIIFYDKEKHELSRTSWVKTPTKRALLFLDNGKQVELIKQR